MRRCIALALVILTTFTLIAGLLATAASPARAGGLESQLRDAHHDLRSARLSLSGARAQYAAFTAEGLSADSGPYLDAIKAAKLRIGAQRARIAALKRRLSAQTVKRRAASGDWLPLVRQVAAQNHLSAAALYRLMSLESGGRATASSGSFHGLYQYCYSTWKGAWNPWRARSIYDGEAQIRATARAINRGWGARMWPNTFPLAF